MWKMKVSDQVNSANEENSNATVRCVHFGFHDVAEVTKKVSALPQKFEKVLGPKKNVTCFSLDCVCLAMDRGKKLEL